MKYEINKKSNGPLYVTEDDEMKLNYRCKKEEQNGEGKGSCSSGNSNKKENYNVTSEQVDKLAGEWKPAKNEHEQKLRDENSAFRGTRNATNKFDMMTDTNKQRLSTLSESELDSELTNLAKENFFINTPSNQYARFNKDIFIKSYKDTILKKLNRSK